MESDSTQFDRFRSVVVSGIDSEREPPLLPTLIVENADGIAVNVLVPAPEYQGVRQVTNEWFKNTLNQNDQNSDYCLAFAIADNKIEMQTSCNGIQERLLGILDRQNQTITWDDPTDHVHFDV